MGCLANGIQVLRIQKLKIMVTYLNIVDHCTLWFFPSVLQFQIHAAMILVVKPRASTSFVLIRRVAPVIKWVAITRFECVSRSELLCWNPLFPSILYWEDLIFNPSDSLVVICVIRRVLSVVVSQDILDLAFKISLQTLLLPFSGRRSRLKEEVVVFLRLWLHYKLCC